MSAMIAGTTSTICTNPLWVIKTRFMTQPRGEERYKHTLDAFLTIYRSEGISAFYRGLFTSLLGISHVAVQFPLYEQLKRWFQGKSNQPLSSTSILACSGISKMTASIATYPHEVLRTRLQTQRRLVNPEFGRRGPTLPPSQLPGAELHGHGGIIRTFQMILKNEGWRGLYKGLSVNLFRTVPNSAVTLLTYELIMRRLRNPEPL